MTQKIKDLRTQCNLCYNAKSMLVHRENVIDALDYINRLEMLVLAQNALIDQSELGVKCNDCPFVNRCIFKNPSKDCQLTMANNGRSMNCVI